jgi:hypothetical protein
VVAVPHTGLLAVSSEAAQVSFVDPARRARIGQPLAAQAADLLALAASPDGTRIAAVGWDGALRLWDRASGRALGTPLEAHGDYTRSIAWLDREHLLTGSFIGGLIAWDMAPAHWAARACALAGRDLTPAEWARYLPGQPYRRTCAGRLTPEEPRPRPGPARDMCGAAPVRCRRRDSAAAGVSRLSAVRPGSGRRAPAPRVGSALGPPVPRRWVMSFTVHSLTSPALTRAIPGVVAVAWFWTAVGAAAGGTPADINANGIPFSAVDQTMGIGVVPKTLPSPTDENVKGIPLSALDQTLGLDG